MRAELGERELALLDLSDPKRDSGQLSRPSRRYSRAAVAHARVSQQQLGCGEIIMRSAEAEHALVETFQRIRKQARDHRAATHVLDRDLGLELALLECV